MQNTSTCIAKSFGSFMAELAHAGLKCHCDSCVKPQEQKAIRETEIADLLREITFPTHQSLIHG